MSQATAEQCAQHYQNQRQNPEASPLRDLLELMARSPRSLQDTDLFKVAHGAINSAALADKSSLSSRKSAQIIRTAQSTLNDIINRAARLSHVKFSVVDDDLLVTSRERSEFLRELNDILDCIKDPAIAGILTLAAGSDYSAAAVSWSRKVVNELLARGELSTLDSNTELQEKILLLVSRAGSSGITVGVIKSRFRYKGLTPVHIVSCVSALESLKKIERMPTSSTVTARFRASAMQ